MAAAASTGRRPASASIISRFSRRPGTMRPRSPRSPRREWFNRKRTRAAACPSRKTLKLEPSFEGFVDTFNDGVVAGWALDQRQPGESIEVDLYIDGEYAGSAAADLPRPDLFAISPASQKKGFRFNVKPLIADCFLPRIDLYFGGSLEKIPVNTLASLYLNRPFIDVREFSGTGPSRWIPTPPAEIITYITGRDGSAAQLQREYLHSGLVNSADVHNLLLDLQAPVRK